MIGRGVMGAELLVPDHYIVRPQSTRRMARAVPRPVVARLMRPATPPPSPMDRLAALARMASVGPAGFDHAVEFAVQAADYADGRVAWFRHALGDGVGVIDLRELRTHVQAFAADYDRLVDSWYVIRESYEGHTGSATEEARRGYWAHAAHSSFTQVGGRVRLLQMLVDDIGHEPATPQAAEGHQRSTRILSMLRGSPGREICNVPGIVWEASLTRCELAQGTFEWLAGKSRARGGLRQLGRHVAFDLPEEITEVPVVGNGLRLRLPRPNVPNRLWDATMQYLGWTAELCSTRSGHEVLITLPEPVPMLPPLAAAW